MIINEMPQSEAAFTVARDALLNRLRTGRTTGINVLSSYLDCRDRGLTEPENRAIYEKCQTMTLADVVAPQERWVKDRTYTYAILANRAAVDMDYISTLGPVRQLTLEEIFGY